MTILISGAGIGGLAAAIALAEQNFDCHIVEQANEFSEVGAGIQIGPNGMLVLEQLGLMDNLRDRGAAPEAIRLFDGISGECLNEVPLGGYAEARYGAPYKVFHRAELQMAMLEKARALPRIKIETGFRTTKYVETEDQVTIRAITGEEREGRLLIGADGLWSRTRRQLFPDITPSFFGKSAWRTIVPTDQAPKPFSNLATGLWMAPGAHLVHYPVMNGKAVNVVAVINENFDKVGWTTEGDTDELLYHYQDWHETPRQFINDITGWQKWALFRLEQIPAWSRGRIALLGDAAHPPIPFLAQGGVMAIEDAYALANELETFRDDHRTAFKAYEKRRRNRAYRVMDTATKLGTIYHMGGLMRHARNLVLRRKRPEQLLASYDWLYGFAFSVTS